MKVVFFGTPELSVPFLQALCEDADVDVVGVVSQPDKPVGRNAVLTAPPVVAFAKTHGLPAYQWNRLKDPEAFDTLKNLQADLFVVVAYGKLIPSTILNLPRLGCVNVHPSLLPKHRGPIPVPAAILAGETETGVTIMLLDEGMDTGPILAQEKIPVDPTETTPSLSAKATVLGVPLLLTTLKAYYSGAISPQPQSNEGVTVDALLEREDGLVDLNHDDPVIIDRKFRAYQPWPGIYTQVQAGDGELRVKILAGRLQSGSFHTSQVQPEGKKPMSIEDFTRGYGKLL